MSVSLSRAVFVFGVLLVGACSSDSVGPPPKPPVGSLEPAETPSLGANVATQKERELPELYAAALASSGDAGSSFSRLVPLLNPDLAGFWSPTVPPAHDSAGIVAAHEALFGAFDDRTLKLSRIWRTASEQSIEWTMTGKQEREWMGVPPTHRAVAFRGLTLLWTKDDGTLVDIHVYFDAGLLRGQLLGTAPKELTTTASSPPAAVAGPPQVFEATPASEAEEARNVGIVKSWLGALENNKEADYLDVLADAIEVVTDEARWVGRDDARKYYKAVHKAIGQLDTTVNDAWGTPGFAVVEYDIDGEQLGSYSWVPLLASMPPRTTQLAHFDLVDVCEIRDGKISHVSRFGNPSQVLGRPAPPAADGGVRP
jgi:hypothetical protein